MTNLPILVQITVGLSLISLFLIIVTKTGLLPAVLYEWGVGLFPAWAAEHPETVAVIYADAPVCDLGFMHNRDKYNAKTQWLDYYRKESRRVADAYRTDVEKLSLHPLSPNNNFLPIAKAGIPILCIRSGQDLTVPPESNIDIFAERLRKAGGRIEIIHAGRLHTAKLP